MIFLFTFLTIQGNLFAQNIKDSIIYIMPDEIQRKIDSIINLDYNKNYKNSYFFSVNNSSNTCTVSLFIKNNAPENLKTLINLSNRFLRLKKDDYPIFFKSDIAFCPIINVVRKEGSTEKLTISGVKYYITFEYNTFGLTKILDEGRVQ